MTETKRKPGYAEKIRARRRLAHKHNLPDMPYPVLWATLESMGVDTSKLKGKQPPRPAGGVIPAKEFQWFQSISPSP